MQTTVFIPVYFYLIMDNDIMKIISYTFAFREVTRGGVADVFAYLHRVILFLYVDYACVPEGTKGA